MDNTVTSQIEGLAAKPVLFSSLLILHRKPKKAQKVKAKLDYEKTRDMGSSK